MPTALGSRPTFSCCHPNVLEFFSPPLALIATPPAASSLRPRRTRRSSAPRSASGFFVFRIILLLSALFPLGRRQKVGHLFVLRGVTCPALRCGVPAVIEPGHVDTAIDEESGRIIVAVHGA